MGLTIADLKKGEQGIITDSSSKNIPLKLLEMGCLPGNRVKLLQLVPQIMGLELFEKANNPKFSYFPDNDDHMMEYNEELLSKIKKFINKL